MQDAAITQLPVLLSAASPPFVFIHIPSNESPRLVARQIKAVLDGQDQKQFRIANIDGVHASVHMRINFDDILSAFATPEAAPSWEEGCPTYSNPETGQGFNSSFPAFLQGLRHISKPFSGNTHLLLLVVNPGHLVQSNVTKDAFQSLCNITELAELSVPLTAVMVSVTPWALLTPSLGLSPEPLVLSIPVPTKSDIESQMLSLILPVDPPEPTLTSILAASFIQRLVSLSAPVTNSSHVLTRVLAKTWLKFIAFAQSAIATSEAAPTQLPTPTEARLIIQKYTATLHKELLFYLPSTTSIATIVVDPEYPVPNRPSKILLDLPILTQFVLVAAYICSYNPPRVDMRLFYRGSEDNRAKKKGGGTKKIPRKKSGAKTKVPQSLLGPTAFTTNRLLAIMGSLLAEHDTSPYAISQKRGATEDKEDKEDEGKDHPDVETQRVSVLTSLSHAANLSFLTRLPLPTSSDRGQGQQYKCNLTYEEADAIARNLQMGDIRAQGLIWES